MREQSAGCGLAVAAADCKAGFSLSDVAKRAAPFYYLVSLGIDRDKFLHICRYCRRVDYKGVILVLRNLGWIIFIVYGYAFAFQSLGQRARGSVISGYIASAALVISCKGAHSNSADPNKVNVLWLMGLESLAFAEFEAFIRNFFSCIRLGKSENILFQRGSLCVIADERFYSIHQLLLCFRVLDYHCGVFVYQRHSIVCLVVFRYVRARHEYGAFSCYTEF